MTQGTLKKETKKLEESLTGKILGGQQSTGTESEPQKVEEGLKKLIPGSLFK